MGEGVGGARFSDRCHLRHEHDLAEPLRQWAASFESRAGEPGAEIVRALEVRAYACRKRRLAEEVADTRGAEVTELGKDIGARMEANGDREAVGFPDARDMPAGPGQASG